MDISISKDWSVVIVIALIWDMAWKGVALWKASKNNQPAWFVALLVLNTLGFLPIIYLIYNWDKQNVPTKTGYERTTS